MYSTVSRSGTSSTSTPQQQQLQQLLPAAERPDDAAGAQRPSTRRGGRPESNGQSGGGGGTSADGSSQVDGEGYSASSGGSSSSTTSRPKQQQQQQKSVDVWTRRDHRLNSSGSSSLTSASSSGSRTSAADARRPETEEVPRHNAAYPELSEPERYTDDDQFESDEDNAKRKDADGEQFTKRLHELVASQRTRSLRDPLLPAALARQQAVQAPPAALPPPLTPPSLHHSANNSRASSRKSSMTNAKNAAEHGDGISPAVEVSARRLQRTDQSNGWLEETNAENDSQKDSPRSRPPALAPFVSRLPGTILPANNDSSKMSSARRQSSGSHDVQNRRPTKEISMEKIPLGFGSSSSRGFVLSATGRTAPAALEQRPRRNASASAAIRRNSADSATYKAWLRKKQEAGQAKRHREAARVKEEAEKRAEQKKLAEVNFERWRRELDTRIAARKVRDKRAAEAHAEREKRVKEEQKANAEKTFAHWKRAEEERLRRERTHAQTALLQRRADEQRRKEEKRTKADTAFQEWLKERNERRTERARLEHQNAEASEREQNEQADKRKQIAHEAYDLWSRMKGEERRYTQSVAYRILDFERQASQRWSSTPWLPTSPSTVSKIHRPSPGQANGRRQTLERRLVLPFTRLSSADPKKQLKAQKSVENGRRSASARRAWR